LSSTAGKMEVKAQLLLSVANNVRLGKRAFLNHSEIREVHLLPKREHKSKDENCKSRWHSRL
jgi:hypothetical protein